MEMDESASAETDGKFNITVPTPHFDLPQAELVAQLYPKNNQAAKDAAEKSLSHPAVVQKMTSVLWDVERY